MPLIVGTGIDIIEISRIQEAVDKWGDAFLEKILTPEEILNSKKYQIPYQHYAGRFAAKEAVYKALNDKTITWRDITILNDKEGKPYALIRGELPVQELHISISHSKYYAVANAIVEAS